MIILKYLISLLFILLISLNVFSQDNRDYFVGGTSILLMSRIADYDLTQQYDIVPGYYIGYQNDFSLGDHYLTGEIFLDYYRVKFKENEQATDDSGSPLASMQIVNREINLSAGLLYNLNFQKLSIGLGVRFEGNVYAETIGNSALFTYKESGFNIRKLDIKLPIDVSYSFGKLSTMIRYERGLINRLGPKTKEIREFENLFRLGIKYSLN